MGQLLVHYEDIWSIGTLLIETSPDPLEWPNTKPVSEQGRRYTHNLDQEFLVLCWLKLGQHGQDLIRYF